MKVIPKVQTRMKKFPRPKNWDEYKVEIDEILRHYLPNYKEHKYITPAYYIGIIKEEPKRFPVMAKKAKSTQVRYINYFLVEQGRVPWNDRISKRQTLMIPDEVVTMITDRVLQSLVKKQTELFCSDASESERVAIYQKIQQRQKELKEGKK